MAWSEARFDEGITCTELAAALNNATQAHRGYMRYVPEVVDAAVDVGFIVDSEFVRWYSANRNLLLQARASGRGISAALTDESYKTTFVMDVSGKTSYILIASADSDCEFCTELLRGYFQLDRPPRARQSGTLKRFIENFSRSLGFTPSSLKDFTVDTLTTQLNWFNEADVKGRDRSEQLRIVAEFYRYVIGFLPEDQDAFTYETGLVSAALVHQRFPAMWLEGYRTVVYNPLDPPPSFCKWLLFPNKSETNKASFVAGRPVPVDLETHPDFQRLLIDWAWTGGLGATSVRTAVPYCKTLINAIADAAPAVVSPEKRLPIITMACVENSMAVYAYLGSSQMRAIRFWFRSFLEFGDSRGAFFVERACYLVLDDYRMKVRHSSGDEAVSKEDLVALAAELERSSSKSIASELAYAVFCTQSLTLLRSGEILTLKKDDIREGTRPGIYIVSRVEKPDDAERYDTQIPKSIYDLLRAIITATQEIREDAPEDMRDYVFLKRRNLSAVSVMSPSSYRDALKKACENVGIDLVNPSSVRKRYMTEVIEQGIRNNISRLALGALTGHASDRTTNEFYLREDIRNYLEAVHGIEIGRPHIVGEIVPDSLIGDEDESNTVNCGAGVCRNESCSIAGTIPCLMCRGFVTAPRFIPQMKEALSIVQKQIVKAPSEHDRTHLIAVKKLFLSYLGKMMELKEDDYGLQRSN